MPGNEAKQDFSDFVVIFRLEEDLLKFKTKNGEEINGRRQEHRD